AECPTRRPPLAASPRPCLQSGRFVRLKCSSTVADTAPLQSNWQESIRAARDRVGGHCLKAVGPDHIPPTRSLDGLRPREPSSRTNASRLFEPRQEQAEMDSQGTFGKFISRPIAQS